MSLIEVLSESTGGLIGHIFFSLGGLIYFLVHNRVHRAVKHELEGSIIPAPWKGRIILAWEFVSMGLLIVGGVLVPTGGLFFLFRDIMFLLR